jgi:hypothetical protein
MMGSAKSTGDVAQAGAFDFDAETGGLGESEDYSWWDTGFAQTDQHPVVNVSWNDAIAFCKCGRRNGEGKVPGLGLAHCSTRRLRLRGPGWSIPTECFRARRHARQCE